MQVQRGFSRDAEVHRYSRAAAAAAGAEEQRSTRGAEELRGDEEADEEADEVAIVHILNCRGER